MKRNILIFGGILGAILVANMIYMVNLCYTNPTFESNDVLGYAAMVVIFSLVFFGIRNYRNHELGGTITFGRAFKTGVFIALVGSTMYVVVWLFYYYLFVPDYLDKYIPHVLLQAERNGATSQEIAETSKKMEDFREMYKSTFFVIVSTFLEVFPIGVVVALVSALILKKKPDTVPSA